MVNSNLGWNRGSVRSTDGTPHRGSTVDMMASVDGWVSDDYLLEFWHMAQGYVVKHHGHLARSSNITVEELQGVGIEVLFEFARVGFADACERMGATPHDKRLFWILLKRRLNWDVNDYLTKTLRFDASVDALNEVPTLAWMRSIATHYFEESSLHQQLARATSELQDLDRMILALCFYEQMTRKEVAAVLGLSVSTLARRTTRASQQVLHAAANLIKRLEPITRPVPLVWDRESAARWTEAHYGVGIDAYLEWVAVAYRADVSYLVDILAVGNGNITRTTTRDARSLSSGRVLTDDQVNDIRTRIEAGEKYASIMAEYRVSDATISSIKTGRTYAWVPRRQEPAA